MQERHPIKHLAPAWFAVVMGTGGLANILFQWQNSLSLGYLLGTILAVLAGIIYFVVLVPWFIRWFWFFDYANRDLNHPLTGNFYVTMPVATTVLGTNIYLIWGNFLSQSTVFNLIFGLWIISIIGVSFFTFYLTFTIMRVEETPSPDMINFSWIMAPIANMAISLIGNPVLKLTTQLHPTWSISILVTNIALFGIGFFLFIFISAIVFVRLANHPLPPADKIPSFGILLGAIGLAVSGIIDTAENAHTVGFLSSTDLLNLISVAVWGFGIWIVGLIMIICMHQNRNGGIPFSMGWWAFIFPLATYTIASQKIAAIFLSPLTISYAVMLTILLLLLWVYTFINTVRGAVSGKLFTGPQIQSQAMKSRIHKRIPSSS